MTVAYPTAVPSDEIKSLFDMLTGKVEADLNTALHSGWVVQGYLQGLIWPEGGESGPKAKVLSVTGEKVPKLTDEQAVMALGVLANKRTVKAQFQAQGLLGGGVVGGRLKEEIAKMLLPVLLNWIKKWVNGGGLDKLIEKIIGEVN